MDCYREPPRHQLMPPAGGLCTVWERCARALSNGDQPMAKGTPLQHILVAVDFSETSDRARDYAFALARQAGASVELLHVFQWPIYAGPLDTSEGPSARLIEDLQKQQEAALLQQERSSKDAQVHVRTTMRKGIPHEAIVQQAQKSQANLIVMGTRGRTGLSHALLGSVAERVVRTSPIPVLTVGDRAADELEAREPLERADA